jgi:multiple sugar transport system ATP-binding protein
MNRGRLLQTADPLMLYRHPANLFVAGFIGSPPMNLLPGRFRLGPAGPLFEAEAAAGDPAWTAGALPLPTEAAARLASRGHRPVVLGVRPEDTRLWRPEAPGQPASTLAASVELVERLGPETLVHLQAGPHRLVARVGGAESLEPHQAVRVALERDRLHLFDPVTEQALL